MRNLFLTVAYFASIVAVWACTAAEQQQAVQGVDKAASATHATSELCLALARNFGLPELEAKCKTAHDASELILQNLPTVCALPDAGGQ